MKYMRKTNMKKFKKEIKEFSLKVKEKTISAKFIIQTNIIYNIIIPDIPKFRFVLFTQWIESPYPFILLQNKKDISSVMELLKEYLELEILK